jgi:hypothetical protein
MSKDLVLGRVVFGPQSKVRTLVRIKPDGEGVLPLLPDGTQLVDTNFLREVIATLRDLASEIEQINPRVHPVKEVVMHRWATILSDCAEKLSGGQEMPNATD